MLVGERQTSIAKLRFAASDRDRINVRLDLERLIASADMYPSGLPPAAILCVNKLSAAHPARSDRFGAEVAWQRALRTSLTDIAAKAARLSVANPSAAGNAVVFGSWPELMACLARDWSAGNVSDRWWWRTILKPSESAWALWQRSPEYIPAALEHLTRAGKAVEVVAKFTDAQAFELTQLVIDSFGLRALAGINEFHQQHAAEKLPADEPAAGPQAALNEPHGKQHPKSELWLRHVPEVAAPQLSRRQQKFLGIGLMIQRAPAVVRTRQFARDVEQWQEQFALLPDRITVPKESEETINATTADIRTVRVASANAPPEPRPAPLIETSGELPASEDAKRFAYKKLAAAPETETIQPNYGGDAVDQHCSRQPTAKSARTSANQVESSQSSLPAASTVPLLPVAALAGAPTFQEFDSYDDSSTVTIETNLGGLLYLINLAMYLDLYGDFTSPMAQGIELDLWDFVTLVGSELVGDTAADDPIWALLATLARRDDEQAAGAGFEPEDRWRMPAEWLLPFRKGQPGKWNASRGRLRVWHPEGFLIVDVPLAKGNSREQLRTEIKQYGASIKSLTRGRWPRLSPSNSAATVSPAVRRWLSRLMPYVRARLRVALGLESNESLGAVLCRRYARVQATDTHVDVFFGLADLPLQIRFAGLDRDPGWVPAAGRFIAFHFD